MAPENWRKQWCPDSPNPELIPMTTIFLALLLYWAPQSEVQFSRTDARLLVRNAPAVSGLADRCLGFEELKWPDDPAVIMFSVYDNCSKATSRSAGLYFVNLRTGNVYIGSPDNPPVQSERLKRTRESLLRKKDLAKKKTN